MLINKTVANSYFGKLFRADKRLFLVILFFFAFSLFSNLIKLQTSPFFIWDMYSTKSIDKEIYSFYEIHYNDSNVLNITHTWHEPAKTFLVGPLSAYLAMKTNNSVDPFETYLKSHWIKKHPAFENRIGSLYNTHEVLNEFPEWYKKYLSSQVNSPVKNVYVLNKKLRWEKNGDLTEISSDTALIIR
jgi:hypothetical protein